LPPETGNIKPTEIIIARSKKKARVERKKQRLGKIKDLTRGVKGAIFKTKKTRREER
jgi:hypothetical protein